MSTALEVEQVLHDWLCGDDCVCQTQPVEEKSNVTPASIHGDTRKWDLMRVIVGQREEADLLDNGWQEIWCADCDRCSEPFMGALDSFADQLIELDWDVLSTEHNHAICPGCQEKEDEAHYAEQYRAGSGGIL